MLLSSFKIFVGVWSGVGYVLQGVLRGSEKLNFDELSLGISTDRSNKEGEKAGVASGEVAWLELSQERMLASLVLESLLLSLMLKTSSEVVLSSLMKNSTESLLESLRTFSKVLLLRDLDEDLVVRGSVEQKDFPKRLKGGLSSFNSNLLVEAFLWSTLLFWKVVSTCALRSLVDFLLLLFELT